MFMLVGSLLGIEGKALVQGNMDYFLEHFSVNIFHVCEYVSCAGICLICVNMFRMCEHVLYMCEYVSCVVILCLPWLIQVAYT